MQLRFPFILSLAFLIVQPAHAEAKLEGYLCCNMRSDGSWISDINYIEAGKKIIPAGTPLKVTGYGRQRVYVALPGGKQALGNDYSRDLDLDTFAARYVARDDPALKLATYPANIRAAITSARITPGMNREQVFMAVGYPVSSENPSLAASLLRFWTSSFAEFQVKFDDMGLVREVFAAPETRNLVVYEP